MIKLLYFMGLVVFTSFSYPPDFEKKIDAAIKRVWVVNEFYTNKIDAADSLEIELYSIISNDRLLGYYSVNKVNACRMGGCSRPMLSSNSDEFEHFWCLVIYDRSLKIKRVQILEYNASHGEQICSQGWLKQFNGHSGCDISYSNDVDAVSGATISAISLIERLNYICATFILLQQKGVIQ